MVTTTQQWTRSCAPPAVVAKTRTRSGELTEKGKQFLAQYYGNVWHQVRSESSTPMTRCSKPIREWWFRPHFEAGEEPVLQEGERFCQNCQPQVWLDYRPHG